MEIWQIVLIIAGIMVFLFIIFRIIRRKKKKEKKWLIFEEEKGINGDIQKRRYALNKKTGERKYF